MKHAPVFLFTFILLSGCVTGNNPVTKPDPLDEIVVKKDATIVLLHGAGAHEAVHGGFGQTVQVGGLSNAEFSL